MNACTGTAISILKKRIATLTKKNYTLKFASHNDVCQIAHTQNYNNNIKIHDNCHPCERKTIIVLTWTREVWSLAWMILIKKKKPMHLI